MINILLVIIGSIAYGFIPIFTKNVISYSYSSLSIVFYRYFIASIALFFIIIFTKKSFKVSKRQLLDLFIFSILGLGLTYFLLSESLFYISAGLSNMIHFGYPIVVILIMTTVYKERLDKFKILSSISTIIGIILLTTEVKIESYLGVVYSLLTTITYSIYIISNKQSSFSTLDTIVSLFYLSIIISIVFLLLAIYKNSFQLLNNINVLYNFIGISILCTVFSLGLLLYGVKKLGSSLASILNMFEPTTTVLVSTLFYDEKLTIKIIFGSIFILLSTIFIILSNKYKVK